MYRKPVSLLLILACLALATACSKKDSEINTFVTDINTFTDELVKKVDSAPNKSQGVDEAQKYLDSRKDELKAKATSVNNISESQISKETFEKFKTALTQDVTKIGQLQDKYGSDPAVRTKIQKLLLDYAQILKP